MTEKRYLDEVSLGRFLRERLDADVVADKVLPGAGRIRPDYLSERHGLVIEYDGNQHYQRAAHVIRDRERDRAVEALGYRVIRIPYFVQLTGKVIELLFGKAVSDRSDFKDFPHGFIAKAVVFPADFCELGVERFKEDLKRFEVIADDIKGSLDRAAVESYGGDWQQVYPPSMLKGVADVRSRSGPLTSSPR